MPDPGDLDAVPVTQRAVHPRFHSVFVLQRDTGSIQERSDSYRRLIKHKFDGVPVICQINDRFLVCDIRVCKTQSVQDLLALLLLRFRCRYRRRFFLFRHSLDDLERFNDITVYLCLYYFRIAQVVCRSQPQQYRDKGAGQLFPDTVETGCRRFIHTYRLLKQIGKHEFQMISVPCRLPCFRWLVRFFPDQRQPFFCLCRLCVGRSFCFFGSIGLRCFF